MLVINKIDTVEKEELLSVMQVYGAAHDFAAIVPISAKRNEGVDELLGLLAQFLPRGPSSSRRTWSPTSRNARCAPRSSGRSCCSAWTRKFPTAPPWRSTTFSERDDGIIDLDATIYCEKASHKGIIIGKGGAMLKKISTLARTDIEAFMGTKVFLQTWVKVKENWRDNMNLIKNFRIPGRVRAQKLPLINGTRPANLKTERGLCHELGGAALAAVLQTGLPEVYSLYRRVKG